MFSLRKLSLLIAIAALLGWLVAAWAFAPPLFAYRIGFMAAAAFLALITYRTPVKGWWLFIALIPLVNIPSRILAIGAHDAVTFLAFGIFIAWVLSTLIAQRPFPKVRPTLVPLLLIIIISLTSIVWTLSRYVDFSYFLNGRFENAWVNRDGIHASFALEHVFLAGLHSILFPLIFYMGYALWSSRTQRIDYTASRLSTRDIYTYLAVVWSIALIPALLIALYQANIDATFAFIGVEKWHDAVRASGGLTDPNALGLFLFLVIPLIATAVFLTHGIHKLITAWVGLLALYTTTLTGSRSVFLGFAILAVCFFTASVIYVIIKRPARQTSAVAITIAAVCMIIISAPFLIHISDFSEQNPTLSRIRDYFVRTHISPSGSMIDKRSLQWQQAFTMWREYPASGVGVGAFSIELPNYNRDATQETPVDNAWSQYFHWLAELGGGGAAVWLWFIFACAFHCIYGVIRDWRAGDPARFYSTVTCITLGTFLFLCIFGAHLQASEVAAAAAVISALLYTRTLSTRSQSFIMRVDLFPLLIAALIIFISQGRNALNSLERDAQAKRFNLPRHFGFYSYESWQDMFIYQWTKPYAGSLITIPGFSENRILTLRLAAIDPAISATNPRLATIRLNGLLLTRLNLTAPEWSRHNICIYDAKPGSGLLTFECEPPWYPPNETPPRVLGIALDTNIMWSAVPNWESQGFSEWQNEMAEGTNVTYRWMLSHAACRIPSTTQITYRVGVRAPEPLTRYADPATFTIATLHTQLVRTTLPHDGSWTWETFTTPDNTKTNFTVLLFSVSKLETVRIHGSTRRTKRGAAVSTLTPVE